MGVDIFDSRVLGALRFVNATTGAESSAPLQVSAQNTLFIRNQRMLGVKTAAPGLDGYMGQFKPPPPSPAVESVAIEVDISDPNGRYLARRSTIRLPRDADL